MNETVVNLSEFPIYLLNILKNDVQSSYEIREVKFRESILCAFVRPFIVNFPSKNNNSYYIHQTLFNSFFQFANELERKHRNFVLFDSPQRVIMTNNTTDTIEKKKIKIPIKPSPEVYMSVSSARKFKAKIQKNNAWLSC